jgi:hypothetical protein
MKIMINLDDLKSDAQKKIDAAAKADQERAHKMLRSMNTTILPNEEEFEEDDDDTDDLKEQLTHSLLLMHDMNNLLTTLRDPLRNGKINVYLMLEIDRISDEATAFLKGCDLGSEKPKDIDEVNEADFNIYD